MAARRLQLARHKTAAAAEFSLTMRKRLRIVALANDLLVTLPPDEFFAKVLTFVGQMAVR
jgi:hypothetical protein